MQGAGADVFQMQVRQQYATLVDAFVALNPKKRKPWAQWIVFAGCLFVLVSLGADRQVRDALFAPRLPGRAPSTQQVLAQAPRSFQQRPAAQPVQVQVQVAPVQVAPVQVGLGDPSLGGMPMFATPGTAPTQQVDPGADPNTKLQHAKAKNGPATKRIRKK